MNTFTSVCKDAKYSLLHTDCTRRTLPYKASCIGKGARRIKTELENLDIDNMTTEEMIGILYIAHDPLKDKELDIEVVASRDRGKANEAEERRDSGIRGQSTAISLH